MKPLAVIDFETLGIGKRPAHYPPKPVGLAIEEPNKAPYYMSWGHLDENNCTFAQAKKKLKELYRNYRIGCHNGKFDLEVAEKFFELPLTPPNGWEDSMLLAFLHNPREQSLSLKPLSDKYLNMPPDEQTKLKNWIIDNVFTSEKSGQGEIVIDRKKPKGYFKIPPTKTGAFIAYAPMKLVMRYAKGDVKRTTKLIKLFYKHVLKMGMLEQYDVERRCVIKTIEMEREGVNVDYKTLEPDLEKAKKTLKRAKNAVQKTLGDINLNSHEQKIAAFESKGLVKQWEYNTNFNKNTYQWERTSKKTSIDSLINVCTDKKLVKNLEIYSKYSKLIGTYMQPWLDSALENNGKFFMWYNTIKGENDKGTYTGRFSSNFQQVPRKPNEVFKGMPFLRNYIVADKKSHQLYNRDFCQQEIRILAHFTDGGLLIAYQNNNNLSGHDFVRDLIAEQSGIILEHIVVKGCNFLIVYGGGAKALAHNAKISLEEAKEVFALHSDALPEVGQIKEDLQVMARKGEMFKTAGGRWYDFEDDKEYVGLNTLIQGSAADHSKRALLNIDDALKESAMDARIMLQIHDEFMLSGAKRQSKKIMKTFKEAMEYDELFDLPMLTDGKIGERWGSMIKLEQGQ